MSLDGVLSLKNCINLMVMYWSHKLTISDLYHDICRGSYSFFASPAFNIPGIRDYGCSNVRSQGYHMPSELSKALPKSRAEVGSKNSPRNVVNQIVEDEVY